MKLIKYISMTLAVSTFASCSGDDGMLSTWESDPEAVRIQVMVDSGNTSRSNPIGPNENQFKEGDKLSLQANGQGPYVYTLINGIWTPSSNEYLTWKTESMNFNAYTTLLGATQNSFTLPTVQNDLTKIAAADYMTFTGTCTRPNGSSDIAMELQRQTSRIDITIDKTASSAANQAITDFTIAGNSIIKDGQSSTVTTFIPYIQEDTENPTYTVLVAPYSAVQSTVTFITLKVNGTPMTVTGIPIAQKGKRHSYKLTINEKAVILSGVSVTDWNTGDIFNGGEIGSYPIKIDAINHTIITKQEGQLTADQIKQATSTEGELIIIGPLNSNDLNILGQEAKSSITSLDLSKTIITAIPAEIFKDSKNLTSLTLPATVTSIGDRFIAGCDKLVNLIIMSSQTTLPTINPSAFTGFNNASNCDLRLDGSRYDQVDEDTKKVFAGQTWKSILDLDGSELTEDEGDGNIGGDGSDYPVITNHANNF